MEEFPVNLPSTWIATTLGEVCSQPQYGYTTKGSDTGTLKLLRTTDITSGNICWATVPFCLENPVDENKYLLGDGDIVISRAGSVGVSYLLKNPERSVFASYLIRFKPYINAQYFKYFLDSPYYWQKIADNKLGIAVPNVNASKLKEIEIPLPPKNEQQRIVAKIEELFSELDNGIASLKVAQQQLKIYRQALLKDAFEGKLTAEWRAQNQDKLESAEALLKRIQQERPQRYQQQIKAWEAAGKQGSKPKTPKILPPLTAEELAKLPALPDGWLWGKWEDIIEYSDGAFKRGPFGSALKKEFFVKSGYKVYEQYCPINDDCSFERYYITDEKFKELEGFAVKANDFLISCSGVTLGRITQVPETYKEGVINQALLRVRINQSIYNFSFFKTFFRSQYFQKRIFENSTGTAIPNVKGVNELKAIPVPILTLVEQEEIINILESKLTEINQLDQTISTSLQQAEALRQSILKKAFSGQLVPQDPNDEPASLFLARIKAENQKKNGTSDVKSPNERRSHEHHY